MNTGHAGTFYLHPLELVKPHTPNFFSYIPINMSSPLQEHMLIQKLNYTV